MVLRGSNIAPPSLQEAEENLSKAKELLKQAKEDLIIAQQETLAGLDNLTNRAAAADQTSKSTKTTQKLSKDELVRLVHELQNELYAKEQTELAAEIEAEKAQNALMNTFKSLAVGGAAGAIARSAVAPLDRVKILMQTSHLLGAEATQKNSSIIGSFRNIIQTEGLARLWRGNFTNCIRVVPHTATQFVAYDKYKNLLVGEHEEMTIPLRLTAGALSGMTAATVTHPMDVIRIRLQTQPELKGIVDSMRSIQAEGGLKTFYKGYTPAMLSLSPFIAINFAAMDTLKKWYWGAEDRHLTKRELQKRNPFATLMLGATAGIFAQTCCYPLDTVRRRMQLKGKTYSSTVNAFVTIAKQEGFVGFYKGMTANALKVVPNNAIRFAAFDFLKPLVMNDTTRLNSLQDKERAWKVRHEMLKAEQIEFATKG